MLNILALSLALLTSKHQSLGRHEYVQTTHTVKYIVTGYASGEAGVGHITRTGHRVHLGVIAVDPRIIPLGSKVYIPIFKKWYYADDTGGLIRGKHIDIYLSSRSEANRFGRKKMDVIIYPSHQKCWRSHYHP